MQEDEFWEELENFRGKTKKGEETWIPAPTLKESYLKIINPEKRLQHFSLSFRRESISKE